MIFSDHPNLSGREYMRNMLKVVIEKYNEDKASSFYTLLLDSLCLNKNYHLKSYMVLYTEEEFGAGPYREGQSRA